MVVSKSLTWVRPYLNKLKKKLPEITQPKKIRIYTHKAPGKNPAMGACYKVGRTITLAPSYHRRGYEGKFRKSGAVNELVLLSTLAHEIAHFHVWEHGPEHAGLTRTIFEAFGVGHECPHCLGAGKICNLNDT